jgi:hypothetical protein
VPRRKDVYSSLALNICNIIKRPHPYKTKRFRALLSSDFIVSAIPIAIILWACIRACFVHNDCHIFEADSKKISTGMTREQVIQIFECVI